MTGSWCAGQTGRTPLDETWDFRSIARYKDIRTLLEEVRTCPPRALAGPFSNLCLQLQPLSAPDSTLANNALRKLGRALS